MDTLLKFSLVLILLCMDGVICQDFESDLTSETGLEVKATEYKNYAGCVRTASVYEISPETEEQVQSAVRVARKYQVRVRAGGLAHAYSNHGPNTGQLIIKMHNYNKDEDNLYKSPASYWRRFPTITSYPGAVLSTVMEFMADSGVQFSSTTSSQRPSLAGIIATGSHGHAYDQEPFSADLVNVQVIQGDGEFREFDVDYNADVFDIFRSHLGLCGIITRLTVKVNPYQFCKKYQVAWPLSNFLTPQTLQGLLDDHYHWIATWTIFNSASASLIEEMSQNGGIHRDWQATNDVVEFIIHQLMPDSTTQHQNDAVYYREFNETLTLRNGAPATGTMQYGYFPRFNEYETTDTDRPTTVQCELAFRDNGNLVNAFNVLRILTDEIGKYAYSTQNKEMPIHRVEFSFTRHNSTCLLCPTSIADVDPHKPSTSTSKLVFVINFRFQWSKQRYADVLIKTIYAAWKAQNLVGLPHLGKYVPTWLHEDVKTLLASNIKTFKQLRAEAGVDVDDIFTNDFLDTILFPDVTREEGTLAGSTDGENAGSSTMRGGCGITSMMTMVVFLWMLY